MQQVGECIHFSVCLFTYSAFDITCAWCHPHRSSDEGTYSFYASSGQASKMLYVVEGDGSTVAMQLEKWTGSIFEGKEEGPSLF